MLALVSILSLLLVSYALSFFADTIQLIKTGEDNFQFSIAFGIFVLVLLYAVRFMLELIGPTGDEHDGG